MDFKTVYNLFVGALVAVFGESKINTPKGLDVALVVLTKLLMDRDALPTWFLDTPLNEVGDVPVSPDVIADELMEAFFTHYTTTAVLFEVLEPADLLA